MNTFRKFILVFSAIVAVSISAYSQIDIDALMNELVDVENPVYMPVVGVGIGYFNYYGNVRNNQDLSFTVGEPGFRINVAAFLSKEKKKQFLRGNFTFFTGSLSGTQLYVPEEIDEEANMYKNLNFKSSINSFGFNIHYSFIKPDKPAAKFFDPFISLGIEMITFDTKTDDHSDNGTYFYWTD